MRVIRTAGTIALALVTAVLCGGWKHGVSSIKPVTQRATLNLNFLDTAEYQFIDFFMGGVASPAVSAGSTYVTSALLDANGWPCTNQVNTSCPNSSSTNPAGPGTGGSINFSAAVPANTTATPNYTGYYCLQGFGSGVLQLNGPTGGTWTMQSAGTTTCAAFNGSSNNCTSSNVNTSTGSVLDDTWSGWCVALTYIGPRQTSDQGGMLRVVNDDFNSNGHYIKLVHLYQQPDGSDFASGCSGLTPTAACLYRHAYKQQLVNADWGAIRFLNWQSWGWGGRFEDRPTPVNEPYPGIGSRIAGLLPYGQASRSANVYTVAGVTGTPTSMKHGEQVIFDAVSAGNNGHTAVTAIAIAGTTVTMTVSSTTGFSTGDVMIAYGDGTQPTVGNLYRFPVTVTIDSGTQLHFTFANASSLTPCSSGSCGLIGEYGTLQVGSGSDRTGYPILDGNGQYPMPADDSVPVNSYSRMCFSKTLVGTTDGSGNFNYGAWWACGPDVVPLEFMTELVNELNAMGPKFPIDLWLNLPAMGMVCSTYYSDPDCAPGSDYPLNAAKTILNGANSYAGLCSQCKLILEHANETWDGSGTAALLAYVTVLPAATGHLGCGGIGTNYLIGSSLMSQLAMQDVQTVYSLGGGRVKYTLGGQGGFTGGAGGTARITNPLNGDGCVPTPPTGASAPITLYDYFNIATYIDGDTTNLTSLANTWAGDVNAHGFTSSQAIADLTPWTDLMYNTSGSGILTYEGFVQTFETAIAPYNKFIIEYEGGWDNNTLGVGQITSISCTGGTVTVNASAAPFETNSMVINNVSVAGYNGVFTATGNAGTFTYTAPGGTCPVGTPTTDYQGYYGSVTTLEYGFLFAAKNSSAWATRTTQYLNWFAAEPHTGYPNLLYIQNDFRWGATAPDTFGATNTEGGGNNPGWGAIGTYNNAQVNYLLKRDLDPANDNSPMWLNEAA